MFSKKISFSLCAQTEVVVVPMSTLKDTSRRFENTSEAMKVEVDPDAESVVAGAGVVDIAPKAPLPRPV